MPIFIQIRCLLDKSVMTGIIVDFYYYWVRNNLEQSTPIEFSAIMEMFYICVA